MRILHQKVWLSQDGETQMLVKRGPASWYIPLSTLTPDLLLELSQVVADALAEALPDSPSAKAAADVLKCWQADAEAKQTF